MLDPSSINQVYADGSFELGLFANGMGLDPSLGSPLVTCGAKPPSLGCCDQDVDALFDRGLASADRSERAAAYKEMSAILNRELPKPWLFNEVRPLAFNKRVAGLAEHFARQPLLFFNLAAYNEVELMGWRCSSPSA